MTTPLWTLHSGTSFNTVVLNWWTFCPGVGEAAGRGRFAFLIVTTGKVLLPSSRWRSERFLNILQCIKQPYPLNTHTHINNYPAPNVSWVFLVAQISKESTCNAGDLALIPGLGRSSGEGHGNPLQYSCLENPHGQRNLAGCSTWGRKEWDPTEWLSTANVHSLGVQAWEILQIVFVLYESLLLRMLTSVFRSCVYSFFIYLAALVAAFGIFVASCRIFFGKQSF